jgi:hypothetical protein
MFARTAPPPAAAPGADVTARAVGALALAALAVIHVVDLPATLGPTPLVGLGYLGIVAAAVLIGGVLITRSHWLAWAAGGAVAVSAMGGYVLTRAVPEASWAITAMSATGAARWAFRPSASRPSSSCSRQAGAAGSCAPGAASA